MKLSIVTTLYYSAPYVDEFYRRAREQAANFTSEFEIIFVNDGSPDDSLDRAVALHLTDERVRVVDLARNFGHHKAMMTGLEYSHGELIFLIDSDLEEAPELLATFSEIMQARQSDVVFGVQMKRKGGIAERVSGGLYFWLWNLLSPEPIVPNLCTVRLMSRRYVNALLLHREREINIAGLWAITGFQQIAQPIQKLSKGTSAYDLTRKFGMLVNAITSFSNKPLILIFYLGTAISLLALVGALFLVIQRFFFNVLLDGWPSLIVSIWLLGGLTIFCLGIIGIYLSKIFIEAKQRPYTIVRQFYEWSSSSHDKFSYPTERASVLHGENSGTWRDGARG